MAKEKACKHCKLMYTGDKCPKCGNKDSTEAWKGRVIILKPDESEVAKKMKINEKGTYAIKTK
jgi:DNA-directed RNA polymerase subunit E"